MPSDTNVYWDSLDFDSEDNSDFSSSSEQTLKDYIDPWDLENYAYVRKHLEDSTPDPVTTESPTLTTEPTDSTFYYISGTVANRQKSNYRNGHSNEIYGTVTKFAGFDEINFHNEQIYSSGEYSSRAESYYNVKKPRSERQIYTENMYGKKLGNKANQYDNDYSDLDTSSNFKEDNTHQALVQRQLQNLSHNKSTKRRRSALTESIIAKTLTIVKPRRHSVAVNTKSTKTANNKNGSQNQIYSSSKSMYNYRDSSPYYDTNNIYNVKMNKINEDMTTDESIYETYSTYNRYFDPYSTGSPGSLSSVPIYDEATSTLRRRKPQNFGLSNYGHLKIDYSFNWNTLDRFIGK